MAAKKKNDDFFFTLSDFYKVCRGAYRFIFISIVLSVALMIFWALLRPIEYTVMSAFKEKGALRGAIGTSTSLGTALLSGLGDNSENEAISIMRSRKVMDRLVDKLGLQSKVVHVKPTWPFMDWLHEQIGIYNVPENIKVELAYLNKQLTPSLPDAETHLVARGIKYNDEVPNAYILKFVTDDIFEVSNASRVLLGEGRLYEPFHDKDVSFTIEKTSNKPLIDETFVITLLPLPPISKGLGAEIRFESDRSDRSLINLKYSHRDRHFACAHLNALMDIYRDHLKREHKRLVQEQLAYLQKRQDEATHSLKKIMLEYANTLSSDFSNLGFLDSDKAMQFLAGNQQNYKSRLLAIDFDTKRLNKVMQDGHAFYESNVSSGDSVIINQILSELRNLKQQYDTTSLTLRNIPQEEQIDMTKLFEQQLAELQENKASIEEANEIIALAQKGTPPLIAPDSKLAQPKYLVKSWCDKIQDSCAINLDEWEHSKSSFISYLNNLVRSLQVHNKAIEESLAHQQSSQHDFPGLNLLLARDLYLTYTKEINDAQAQIRQLQFILTEMQNPDFEISSLSAIVSDPISRDIIARASPLALSLQDQNNRSSKEQERIKAELDYQKRFLTLHMGKTLDLLNVRQNLLREKLNAVQKASLVLVQEQKTILEQQMADYIATRLQNFEQEKTLIQKQQKELQDEMNRLPSKWVAERLIDQRVQMNQQMGRDITNLVESKIITSNLEIIQSAPAEPATPPIHPTRPRLFIHTIIGIFFGLFFSLTWLLVKTVVKGIPASAENLRQIPVHVSGSLSRRYHTQATELLPADLDTLRRMISHLCTPSHNEQAKTLAVIKGKGPDYSPDLAVLLSKKGAKVMLLPLVFDQSQTPDTSGLLPYLEGKIPQPKIQKGEFYDTIASGGSTRFASELVTSRLFDELLNKLKKEYDWIIAVSSASPTSAEAGSMADLFDRTVVTLHDERLPDIAPLIKAAKEETENKKMTFVIAPETLEKHL